MFNTTLYSSKQPLPPAAERPKTVAIESIGAGVLTCSNRFANQTNSLHIDIEESGVRLHLTVVDTPGFGDFVNNDDRFALSLSSTFRC